MGETSETAEVVDGEGDEGDALAVETGDDLGSVRGLGAAAVQFGANAGEMGPGDMMGWGVGPARKVADNWGNSDVDADGAGRGPGWGDEVKAYVKGMFSRVVGEAAGGLPLDVVFGTYETWEGTK
jgi:hypothetical protein